MTKEELQLYNDTKFPSNSELKVTVFRAFFNMLIAYLDESIPDNLNNLVSAVFGVDDITNQSIQDLVGEEFDGNSLVDYIKIKTFIENARDILLNVQPDLVNITPSEFTIGGYMKALDNKIGHISSTSAGVTSRIYFTADEEVVDGTTYHKTNSFNKGILNSYSQTITVNDNEKLYFNGRFISREQPLATIAPAGIYSGQLTIKNNINQANQRYTIEVYRYQGGTIINSGVNGSVVGSLGFNVVAILDSGLVNLPADIISTVDLSGTLTGDLNLDAGDRLVYIISGEKVGTAGNAIDMTLYSGKDYNSYYDIAVVGTSDNTLNRTSIVGITIGDVLEYLNTKNFTFSEMQSEDSSILLEDSSKNIESNVSVFSEEFETDEVCNLTFEAIQFLGVYDSGIKLNSTQYQIIDTQTIEVLTPRVGTYIEIQYTHLKTD